MLRTAQPKPLTPAERKRRTKKVDAIRNLAENLGRLQRKVSKDLDSEDERDRLTAIVVSVMTKTAERVGNEESAENGHVGVTGMRCKNVKVDGDTVRLHYVGKSGVEHDKEFTDKRLAPMVKALVDRCEGKDEAPIFVTADGFKVKADRVNRYLAEFGVRSKDIRGFAANRFMEMSLSRGKISGDEKERKKRFMEALKDVAERVGHTQATLRKHYLMPDVEDSYVKRGKVVSVKNASRKAMIRRVSMRVAFAIMEG